MRTGGDSTKIENIFKHYKNHNKINLIGIQNIIILQLLIIKNNT